ncbi:MAG: HAMP domain-containing protein [Gammaproteobacteria bacterium]|nr:HAMP domain-containing protein [Gammaproteobacteria bacterium]NIR81794.1 HAMP domain-containing protein [Gammaproteobacteria bacterium]NIR88626.1 HAMP domain-containing protein [Gammaproteobacteria bacterium]NIU02902.1 HAMP domain-containing protein [Gammaproteobacteria bacterium]NIV50423.1 HAMP domain-containing protein [Gammaproteobacteria bacterium]
MVLVILASLTLMSEATQGSARFGQLYSVLLIINVLGLLTLAGLIGWNLFRLLAQVRRRMAGARLTVRMVTMFVVLALTPVLVVYYFSLQFLHRGIDSWFDVRVEKALDDSLELSRTALGVRMRELLKQTEVLAGELAVVPEDTAAATLEDARLLSGASELTLMTSKGQPIASSSVDPMAIVPNRPDDAILLQVRQSHNYIGLDPIGDAGLHVRVVARVPDAASGTEIRMLQGLFPVPERMGTLADTVQSAYAQYRELAYLRKPLKTSFTLTLSLVLLLSILTAVWAAFHSARRMVSPLRDVVQGTQAVAGGDYATRLPPSGQDELGFLVESFNEMTRKLARAQHETRQSQQQVEGQRRYLEAVLARLSSGVVTLDHEHRLFTANMAAAQILRVDLESEAGKTLNAISETYPNLQPLTETACAHLDESTGDWREQVILFGAGGRQVLVCRGTPLPGSDHPQPGHVIVFDDLTELIQAQRNAAWSEVARRLAHEIKNPLTPIQLSAERLRHKYLDKLQAADAAGLDRLTRTIVHQVEGMKEMVNAFSDYARNPPTAPKLVDLNELINDVLALYAAEGPDHAIRLHLDPELPPVEADPARLRQVLHNLVKNALEASSGSQPELAVATRCVRESAGRYIEVRITDGGVGFSEAILEHAFEPYATTKPGGTGLGLAIVKKIVEEHGGVVWAENNSQSGATVIIRLPVLATPTRHNVATPRREAV